MELGWVTLPGRVLETFECHLLGRAHYLASFGALLEAIGCGNCTGAGIFPMTDPWDWYIHLPWESKTKQRMVFRMIHVKDSLLPMGKVWSLDFLGLHLL